MSILFLHFGLAEVVCYGVGLCVCIALDADSGAFQ